MKIQIRQSVFETNSSTEHALCIKKNDKQLFGTNQTVVVPDINENCLDKFKNLEYSSIIRISELSFQDKLSILVIAAMCDFETSEFLKCMKILNSVLNELNVTLIVNYNKLYDLCVDNYWHDGIYEFLHDNMEVEYIKNMLTSDDCYYYEYDDDCEIMSEEMENIEEHFNHMENDSRIILRARN